MRGSRRLHVLAFSCILGAVVLLAVGARAWATVHRTGAGCARPAAAVGQGYPAGGSRPDSAAGGGSRSGAAPQPESVSRRAHALRMAGCSAWRQVHNRMRQRHHGVRQRT